MTKDYVRRERLTKKEAELINYYCEYGYSKEDIARFMKIKLTTVNQHISNIQVRWGINSLAEMTRYYFKYYKESLQ